MDLPEIYDTLRHDVGKYADNVDTSKKLLYTDWRKHDEVDGTDIHKVKVNNRSLADDLDEYRTLIENYNDISRTTEDLLQENTQEYLAEEWHNPTNIGYVMLTAKDRTGSFSDEENVKIGDWVLANQDQILTAEDPEELRENLYDVATETGHGAVYRALDEKTAPDTEDWHEQLWDLVTDDLEEIHGEQYSVQDLLEERQETAEHLNDLAADLEGRLAASLDDELREYRPSTGTRLRRSVRKLF